MNFAERDCSHENEIIDSREGTIVCTDCGLIKDQFYFEEPKLYFRTSLNLEYENYIKDIFDKLNIPFIHIDEIITKFKIANPKNNKKQFLICIILEVLNNYSIPISIGDISNLTEYDPSDIFKRQQNDSKIILPLKESMERFCKLLKLTFQDYQLIYKYYESHERTGHQPLTIIASFIYDHVKKNSIDLDINQICETIGISKVSVLRFYKRYLSK